MPKFPRHGMVIAPKTEHGMKARFRCKDGYELRGNPIVVCSFGVWNGETPKCEEGNSGKYKYLYIILTLIDTIALCTNFKYGGVNHFH